MNHYRADIVIPADRIITLILPDDLEPGRAVIEIAAQASPSAGSNALEPPDDDHQDIEWWEEGDPANED